MVFLSAAETIPTEKTDTKLTEICNETSTIRLLGETFDDPGLEYQLSL